VKIKLHSQNIHAKNSRWFKLSKFKNIVENIKGYLKKKKLPVGNSLKERKQNIL
jgi:hypothetical protein